MPGLFSLAVVSDMETERSIVFLSLVCSVKDIEHERTWLNGSIFEVEVGNNDRGRGGQ